MDPPVEILTGPVVIDKTNVKKWKDAMQKLWGEKAYEQYILW